jgi:hypothetical protein
MLPRAMYLVPDRWVSFVQITHLACEENIQDEVSLIAFLKERDDSLGSSLEASPTKSEAHNPKDNEMFTHVSLSTVSRTADDILDSQPVYAGGSPLEPLPSHSIARVPPGLSDADLVSADSTLDLPLDCCRAEYSASPIPSEILSALDAFDADEFTTCCSDADFALPGGGLQTIYEEDSTMFYECESRDSLACRFDASNSHAVDNDPLRRSFSTGPSFSMDDLQTCALNQPTTLNEAESTVSSEPYLDATKSSSINAALAATNSDPSVECCLAPPRWMYSQLYQLASKAVRTLPMGYVRMLPPYSSLHFSPPRYLEIHILLQTTSSEGTAHNDVD